MILTKRFNSTLLLIALALCCLTSTYAAKITTKTNTNSSSALAVSPSSAEVATSTAEETEEATSAEKTAVQPADDTGLSSLSIWGMVRGLWNWLKDDLSESLLGDDSTTTAAAGRTFGKIRRLQMALIPILFKFGIISAMVAFLVVVALKTLFLLKVLILMNIVALLAKVLTFKTNFSHVDHHPAPPTWSYSNWSPPHSSGSGWSAASEPAAVSHPSKEIHLHIHGGQVQPQVNGYAYGTNAQPQQQGWERRNDPYAAYEQLPVISETEAENELNNNGPMSLLPTRYPANHRVY